MRYAARKALCLLLTAAMVAVFLPESSLAASKPFEKTKPCGAMATAVGSEIAVSWEKLKGAQGYYVYESISGSKYARVATTKSLKVVRPVKTKGVTCRYVVRGYKIKSVKQTRVVNGKKQVTMVKKTALSKLSRTAYTTTPAAGKSTLKNYLRGAIMPLGHTMYIWGGGWNGWCGNGEEANFCTGLSPKWRAFAAAGTKQIPAAARPPAERAFTRPGGPMRKNNPDGTTTCCTAIRSTRVWTVPGLWDGRSTM